MRRRRKDRRKPAVNTLNLARITLRIVTSGADSETRIYSTGDKDLITPMVQELADKGWVLMLRHGDLVTPLAFDQAIPDSDSMMWSQGVDGTARSAMITSTVDPDPQVYAFQNVQGYIDVSEVYPVDQYIP